MGNPSRWYRFIVFLCIFSDSEWNIEKIMVRSELIWSVFVLWTLQSPNYAGSWQYQKSLGTLQPICQRPGFPSAAGPFCCFFRLLYSHFLEVQDKICTYWVYLMEHIFFEVRLCIKISMFNGFCGNPGLWQIGCRVTSQWCARMHYLGQLLSLLRSCCRHRLVVTHGWKVLMLASSKLKYLAWNRCCNGVTKLELGALANDSADAGRIWLWQHSQPAKCTGTPAQLRQIFSFCLARHCEVVQLYVYYTTIGVYVCMCVRVY